MSSVARKTFIFTSTLMLMILTFMARQLYLVQKQVNGLQKDLVTAQNWMLGEVNKTQKITSQTANWNQRGIAAIREELDKARAAAEKTDGHKHDDALATVQRLTKELHSAQDGLRAREEQLGSQITDMKASVTKADARLNDVSSDVSSVKTEVAAAKTDLRRTITDLKRAIGDMGVMSGLVATNSKELEVLKALGDRNYAEFVVRKNKTPQKIADVSVVLKKADPGGRRYTVEVIADEMKIQKKDRGVNEPVQFFVAHGKQPYELVVNEVRRDQIVGYLATPKLQDQTQ